MRQLGLMSAVLLALSATAVQAEETKTLEKVIPAKSFSKLVLDVPVGTIQVKASSGSDIRFTVELTPDEDWLGRSTDLSTAQISVREDGTVIQLKVELDDADDVEQSWILTMPAEMAAAINLGVGSVEVEDLTSDTQIDVGVGEVDVSVNTSLYGSIKLDAGVGDTSIKGAPVGHQHDRVLVTSSSQLRGDGQRQLEANVGVGDIEVRDNL